MKDHFKNIYSTSNSGFNEKDELNILIAGVTGDLGCDILECIAKKYTNANLYGIYLNNTEKAEELLKQYSSLKIFSLDLTNEKSAEEFFLNFKDTQIHIAINCVGTDLVKPFLDTEYAEYKKSVSSNLDTAFIFSKYVLDNMNRYKAGVLIHISSMWGCSPASCEVMYSSTKAAINAMVVGLAKEFAPSNIRVNAVAPGFILSKMNQVFFNSPEDLKTIYSEIPLARHGLTSDISSAILFLIENNYITGQIITIDGGFSL